MWPTLLRSQIATSTGDRAGWSADSPLLFKIAICDLEAHSHKTLKIGRKSDAAALRC